MGILKHFLRTATGAPSSDEDIFEIAQNALLAFEELKTATRNIVLRFTRYSSPVKMRRRLEYDGVAASYKVTLPRVTYVVGNVLANMPLPPWGSF